MPSISVDHNLCEKDSFCVMVCPVGNIFLGKDGFPTSGNNCIRCGHCQAVCPYDAITLHEILPQELEIADHKAVDFPALAKFVKNRRSIREFKDQPIPPLVIDELMDAVRWAPTGGNSQLARWIFVEKKETMKEASRLVVEWAKTKPDFSNIVESYEGGYDSVLRGAPHLLLTYSGIEYGSTRLDCAIAMTTLELLAVSKGIGTCWAGFLIQALGERYQPLADLLGVPKGQFVNAALMLGYSRIQYRRVPKRNARLIKKV
jgi:nitroreductase/NAD-dependent dihydropyrimidine dehydrogenase PreA subunit